MSFPPLVDLLPHRPPMLFLDDVVRWKDPVVECRVCIREDALFVANGTLRASVTLEHMAQCVGVYTGLWARSRGEPIRIGYLIGVREASFDVDVLEVGDELEVTARCVWGDTELGAFECSVTRRGEAVARALLSVYGASEGKSS